MRHGQTAHHYIMEYYFLPKVPFERGHCYYTSTTEAGRGRSTTGIISNLSPSMLRVHTISAISFPQPLFQSPLSPGGGAR